MRYLPKSQSDREAMLSHIGVKSVDELFAAIPAEYRLTRDLHIPRSYAESELSSSSAIAPPKTARAMRPFSEPAPTRTTGRW